MNVSLHDVGLKTVSRPRASVLLTQRADFTAESAESAEILLDFLRTLRDGSFPTM